jgi:transposase
LALAAIFDGASRTEAARIAAVTLQIIRDWVVRFNAMGPDGLADRKPPGSLPRLTTAHRAALAATIEAGPIPASHGVVRWRLVDLGQWLWEEFRVSVSKQTLSRELRAMGYRKLSARPRHHAQAEGAINLFIDPAWAVSASQRFEIRDVHYKVRMRVFKFAQAGSIKDLLLPPGGSRARNGRRHQRHRDLVRR